MKQIAINYAKVLYELGFSKEKIEDTRRILSEVPELKNALMSPVVSKQTKKNIIEKVFEKEMHNFLNVLCDHNNMEVIDEIFAAYKMHYNEQKGILEAKLTYVTLPDEEQLEDIKTFLMKKFQKESVELTMAEDPAIVGGFILEAENQELDWSFKGRLEKLQQRLVRR